MEAVLLVLLVVGSGVLLSWPLGRYLHWAMDPGADLGPRRRRFEALARSVAGAAPDRSGGWKRYALDLLAFNALLFVLCFACLALQRHLPLDPDGQGALEGSLIFHTAASFVSNTNLQHYSGETSLSYFSQLVGLMGLQFLSAATGIAAMTAMARGLAGRRELGEFLIDVQRATLLVLLPCAALAAGLYVLGGVPMTLAGAVRATTLEGVAQEIARGPVAAFVAIKQLGTNGGGWFGPNSTHPFENPTFWTNALSLVAIVVLPMACVWTAGRIVGRVRHAAVVFAVLLLFLLAKIGAAIAFEGEPTRAFAELPAVEQGQGNLEGKELRFGAAGSSGALWSVLTTCTSSGSVGAMHDSLNPLTGLMPMAGMWLNAAFGGVGVGMINLWIYVILAVFVAGMLVGRTPEYLERRIGTREMQLATLVVLAHGLFVLVGTAVFCATSWGRDALNDSGPHGFSEILYEFSSAAANNGSGFEGLGDNTVPWNVATGLVMLLNRYLPILLPLAIAGSLAAKRPSARSAGTLSIEDATFGVMLAATIVILGALTFFPAAALGPIAEHILHHP